MSKRLADKEVNYVDIGEKDHSKERELPEQKS